MIPKFNDKYFEIRIENSIIIMTLKEAQQLRLFLNKNHEQLRPNKEWDLCPYEGHSDDCTCEGMGGDR